MKRINVLTSGASLVAFANAKAAAPAPTPAVAPAPPVAAPATPPVDAPAAAPSAAQKRERANVVVVGSAGLMALPENLPVSRRSGKSKYPFDTLKAPQTDPENPGKFLYDNFGLVAMDKKGFSSTLFTANKKFEKQEPKRDTAGNVVMKPGAEMKDAAGTVIGRAPGTEPEMIKVTTKEFVAVEVDPAATPEKISLRIFRTK